MQAKRAMSFSTGWAKRDGGDAPAFDEQLDMPRPQLVKVHTFSLIIMQTKT
jgi:hypothetical protein